MRVIAETLRRTVAGEEIAAFVPYPLPPRDPPLKLDGELAALLLRAQQALARLAVAGEMVPSLDWFIYAFVRKEAVISSQIEGTQATLIDLLEYEAEQATGVAIDDVREVCNYLDAIKYARGQLKSARGLPISTRLLNEAHRRLMRGVRGANKQPGEIRHSQHWIGGTRPANAVFVPAPPEELPALLANFEKYLHAENGLAPLVRIGLAHVQFETIHPYLDGNGRIGRLLITLLLEHWKQLSAPLLYLSLFFKRHRAEYYPPSARMAARSITLRSSRRFPGQEYCCRADNASGENCSEFLPDRARKKRSCLSAMRAKSTSRSRRGGSVIVITLRR